MRLLSVILLVLATCTGVASVWLYLSNDLPALADKQQALWEQYDKAAAQDKPAIRREFEQSRQNYHDESNKRFQEQNIVIGLTAVTVVYLYIFIFLAWRWGRAKENSGERREA